jgi:Methyltransferase domain
VNRIKAVQQALDGRTKRIYLEIGVNRGTAFRRITADEKIAVDPEFKLSVRSRRIADANARATHYFEATSDDFFTSEAAFLEQRGIDVALIDGLHTYGQVVRDVENTLRYLRDDGVIVLHDCKPCARLGRLPRDVVRRLSCAEPLAGSPLAHGTSVVRRCLEGDRPPAQYAARSTNCGAELRFWRRARTEGSSGISPVLLAGTDRGAQLRGSRRRPRAFA